MKKYLFRTCALALVSLLLMQSIPAMASEGIAEISFADVELLGNGVETYSSTYDDYFWKISIYADSDYTIYAYEGDTIDDVEWPETATVQFYTTSVKPTIRDYYTVKVNKPTQEFLEELEVDFSKPSEYPIQIWLDVNMPDEWESIYKNCLAYSSYVVTYSIEVLPVEPSVLYFDFNPPDWDIPIFDNMTPDTWELPETAECFIKDRNRPSDCINLGVLPVVWDFGGIEYEDYFWNGWQCATVYGTVVVDNFDISGVEGISDDQEAQVYVYCPIKPYKPLSFCIHIDNPEVYNFGGGNTRVDFFADYIGDDWCNDFSIWLTEDDGRTFVDITKASNVSFDEGFGQWNRITISGLNADTWYGICLELRGVYPHAGTTETLYFMFNRNNVYTEPSGGDRNGDGRWPFTVNDAGNQSADDDNSNNTGDTGGSTSDSSTGGGSSSGDSTGGGSSSNGGGSSGSSSSTTPSFSSNTGAVSGKRLDALVTVYPKNVPFIDNGAQLQIPTDFIKSLGASKNDTVSVSITKVTKNGFTIMVKVNSKTVDYAGTKPFTLRIPYAPPKDSITNNLIIKDSKGNIQALSYYDPHGYLVMKARVFGSFLIVTGKPVSFSDIENSYMDFMSVRGLVTGAAGQKYNASIAVRKSELQSMLAKLPGGLPYSYSKTSARTNLTYKAAVDLLEAYAKRTGTEIDRKDIAAILTVSENAVLSRYGCVKLTAKFIKKL